MNGRTNRSLLWAWLWILGVVGYMVWSMLSYTGIYRWLADLQIAHWNKYYVFATLGLPLLVLCGPALSWIRRENMARDRVRPAASGGPAANGLARILLLIGLALVLVSFGSWTLSQRLPDGREPAAPLDLAAIERGEIPATKVTLTGRIQPEIAVTVGERSRNIDINTTYVAFRMEGAADKTPVRVFVERGIGASFNLGQTQVFMPEQTGYLIANGLPPLAMADLTRRGVALASPVYLLRPGSTTRREPYYIVAALSGFIGVITAAMAGISRLQKRNARA